MIKVVELFAGVGGFRIGLEGWSKKSPSSRYKEEMDSPYEIVWSNQYEPSTKTQHASNVYISRFGQSNHSAQDIQEVDSTTIPEHDLLVGGFPCQDYSVATTIKNSKGLLGKKGVLWWNIHKIASDKKPKTIFLENVDRLLISPSKQRGRDFAIILQSLNEIGYSVEWRVINAAEYGMPQRRKRVFILAYLNDSQPSNQMKTNPIDWITKNGVLAKSFPIKSFENISEFQLDDNIVKISDSFNGTFENTGIMINGKIQTTKTKPQFNGIQMTLNDVVEPNAPMEFDIKNLERWKYLKGSKREKRINAQGIEWTYSEGAMTFPDPLNKPSRTIITGEGGDAPSRFKHVIDMNGNLRRLMPIELERLNMFPDNHTEMDGISNTKRAFFMGNALVVGVIERIGLELKKWI